MSKVRRRRIRVRQHRLVDQGQPMLRSNHPRIRDRRHHRRRQEPRDLCEANRQTVRACRSLSALDKRAKHRARQSHGRIGDCVRVPGAVRLSQRDPRKIAVICARLQRLRPPPRHRDIQPVRRNLPKRVASCTSQVELSRVGVQYRSSKLLETASR